MFCGAGILVRDTLCRVMQEVFVESCKACTSYLWDRVRTWYIAEGVYQDFREVLNYWQGIKDNKRQELCFAVLVFW